MKATEFSKLKRKRFCSFARNNLKKNAAICAQTFWTVSEEICPLTSEFPFIFKWTKDFLALILNNMNH